MCDCEYSDLKMLPHLNLLVCGNEGVVEKATIGIVNLIFHVDQFHRVFLLLKIFHLEK